MGGAGGVGGWRLTSNKGMPLGDFDWLVVTSTGVGHPRWRAAFGGEPPLLEASLTLALPLALTLALTLPLTLARTRTRTLRCSRRALGSAEAEAEA